MKKLVFLLFITFPLALSAQSQFDLARKGNLAEIKSEYAKNPEIVNTTDPQGNTMLILASYHGNTEAALFIASHTKQIDYKTSQGTALMAAVMSGKDDIVTGLLKYGANPDIAIQDGKTALLFAVFFNKTACAKALIKAGAKKDIKDADGKDALAYARLAQNTELIILLDQ